MLWLFFFVLGVALFRFFCGEVCVGRFRYLLVVVIVELSKFFGCGGVRVNGVKEYVTKGLCFSVF